MAKNQTGIAIALKAWLPTGSTIDEQIANLELVRTAHQTKDYTALLAAATVEEVKIEQKTKRVEDPAPADDGSYGREEPEEEFALDTAETDPDFTDEAAEETPAEAEPKRSRKK